jgi:hypothetical protein
VNAHHDDYFNVLALLSATIKKNPLQKRFCKISKLHEEVACQQEGQ